MKWMFFRENKIVEKIRYVKMLFYRPKNLEENAISKMF